MIVKYLDPRADNYFGYEQEGQAWVLVQTWHVYLHKVRTKKDQYELRQYQCGQKFLQEPTDADFLAFAKLSEQKLKEAVDKQVFSGDFNLDTGTPDKPWRFNRWFIKDFREG